MGIGDIFKRVAPEDDSVELPVEQEEPTEKIMVRVETLTGMIDVEHIERLIREGNILLL